MENPGENQPTDVTYVAMAFEGGLCLVALAGGWLLGTDPLASLYWTPDNLPQHGWAVAWGLVATLPMVAGLILIDHYPVGPLRSLKYVVDKTLVPMFARADVAQLALISVLAGIGEELLFRGLVQNSDRRAHRRRQWNLDRDIGGLAAVRCLPLDHPYICGAGNAGGHLSRRAISLDRQPAGPHRCPRRLRLHRVGVYGCVEAGGA